MSSTVFWLGLERVDAQIGLAATAVLTVIAARLSFDNVQPHVSYLTRMDSFVMGSTQLIFLAMFEVVITSALVGAQRTAAAERLDRWSRGVFPALFTGLIVWALLL